jgi:hypothetical protein
MLLSSQNSNMGDTKLKLKRVQQLRKLLETEGDFPATGAGMRLEQVGCTTWSTLQQLMDWFTDRCS